MVAIFRIFPESSHNASDIKALWSSESLKNWQVSVEHSRSFVKSSIRTVIVSRAYDPSDAISGLSMDNES